MKNFDIKNILIPVDFSETSMLAMKHASFMARLFKANITLLHVIEKNWESFAIVAPEIRISNQSAVEKKIEAKLKELAADIQQEYGITVSYVSAHGNIHDEIVTFCNENSVDAIVMGTHGVSGFEEFFIGSNAYKVVTQAKCPVISVQTHASKLGFNNIVLPIDNSKHSLQKVDVAVEMAKRYASKIHVVGIVDDAANAADISKIEVKLEHVRKFIQQKEVANSSEIMKAKNYAKATLEYAAKIQADLIIIMTEQEEDITGLLLGPYAQQIVNHSKVPVMSITPNINPDLISPVLPY